MTLIIISWCLATVFHWLKTRFIRSSLYPLQNHANFSTRGVAVDSPACACGTAWPRYITSPLPCYQPVLLQYVRLCCQLVSDDCFCERFCYHVWVKDVANNETLHRPAQPELKMNIILCSGLEWSNYFCSAINSLPSTMAVFDRARKSLTYHVLLQSFPETSKQKAKIK